METVSRPRQVTHIQAGEGPAWWVVGDTYTFKAVSEDTDGRFTFFEASVPPQAGPPPHIHESEDEAFYLLEGELEFLDGDRWINAQAGDFVHIPPGRLHCFKNPGSTTSRVLVLFSPAGFEKFFFEIGQPARVGEQAPPPSPDEVERSMAAAPKYGLDLLLPETA